MTSSRLKSHAACRAVPEECWELKWLICAWWSRSCVTTETWPCSAAAWRAHPEGEVTVAPASRRDWTISLVPSFAEAVRALPNLRMVVSAERECK